MSNKTSLWKKSVGLVLSDIESQKQKTLDKFIDKQRKRQIQVSLLSLGTKVYVIEDKKKLVRLIKISVGLSDIEEKVRYLGQMGHVITSDRELNQSKISFKDNKKVWFPIEALVLEKPITNYDVKQIKTNNLSKAKYNNIRQQGRNVRLASLNLNNKGPLTQKQRLTNMGDVVEQARMSLLETSLLHKKKTDNYDKQKLSFFKKLDKIKRNVELDKINID